MILLLSAERIGSPWMGVVFPAIILIASIILSWMLYKRFSKK